MTNSLIFLLRLRVEEQYVREGVNETSATTGQKVKYC